MCICVCEGVRMKTAGVMFIFSLTVCAAQKQKITQRPEWDEGQKEHLLENFKDFVYFHFFGRFSTFSLPHFRGEYCKYQDNNNKTLDIKVATGKVKVF